MVTMPPGGEKLIAFSRTFTKIWMSRSSDALTSHDSGGTAKTIDTFGALAHAEAVDDPLQQRANVDARSLLVRELGVDERDLADAGEQRFHPRDLLLHHPQKPFPLLRLIDLGEHFRGRTNRGQRVLELVRDVGGKRLDEAHVLVEPARQALQRARELADLVVLARAAEASSQSSAAVEDGACFEPQLSQRPHDRRRHEQADDDRHDHRDDEDAKDAEADGVEVLEDREGALRCQGRADDVVADADRFGDVDR